jgi:hypothetical protein
MGFMVYGEDAVCQSIPPEEFPEYCQTCGSSQQDLYILENKKDKKSPLRIG